MTETKRNGLGNTVSPRVEDRVFVVGANDEGDIFIAGESPLPTDQVRQWLQKMPEQERPEETAG